MLVAAPSFCQDGSNYIVDDYYKGYKWLESLGKSCGGLTTLYLILVVVFLGLVNNIESLNGRKRTAKNWDPLAHILVICLVLVNHVEKYETMLSRICNIGQTLGDERDDG